ncbi:hypothetical protein [Pseudotabrizicola alkalilacus]|uniref:hypothetical protein n=1 Tax=Pseudotabrizicola alkalilacus TaxID=2305252 RepID=UPI0013142A92|nr:hypothetical protein [Pseudotabrizicola alkalilacus]
MRVSRSGRVLQAMLVAQVALAGLIVFGDFRQVLPDLFRANPTPPADVPPPHLISGRR